MRKGWRIPAAALLLAALAGAFLAFRGRPAPERARPEGLDTRELVIRWLPEENALAFTQTMTVTNRSDEDWPDLALFSPAFEGGEGSARLRIGSARAGEDFLTPVYTGENAVLPLKQPLRKGEKLTLVLRCLLDIPAGDEANAFFGDDGTAIRLCRVFPVPAAREQGAWRLREDPAGGEGWCAELADYSFSLEMPEGCALSAPCRTERREGRVSGVLNAAEDLCLIIWKQPVGEASAQAGGVRLTAAGADRAVLSRALSGLGGLIGRLTALYGPCPAEQISVCFVSVSRPVALPGLILLDARAADSWDGADVPYLAAWQWFGAGFSSDRFSEGWAADALAEWAGLQALRQEKGFPAYEARIRDYVDETLRESRRLSLTPGSPLSYDDDRAALADVRRGRGCAFLIAADTLTEGRVDAFLRRLMESAGETTLSGPELLARMNAFFQEDLTPLYLDYIHTHL